ncbi:hypothetical protein C8N26_1757 [Tenacibaculum lutimaris]|uniref:Uncharacterized protein n=1 Tax=Tenacibaculum lutimaris TaxID=285258 RepID=A0A420DZU7_9FLAO|nr:MULTISPECIES: hypothetical protein [Tenacibaculum]RKF03372.1 hypothetical protein C8N26_1757 [Tenacibaculum lutimaris]
MKYILLIFATLMLMAFQEKKDKNVFICKSVASERYHLKKTCRGLSTCKTEIKTIVRKKAESYGRTLCKIEAKQLKGK